MSCEHRFCNIDKCNRELTFAEAMALDPSEVEFMVIGGPQWRNLFETADTFTLAHFRCAKFRRSRPKRSRVEEMAEHVDGRKDEYTRYAAYDMERAIRAVCEYLRSWSGWKSDGADIAKGVENHFLEPR